MARRLATFPVKSVHDPVSPNVWYGDDIAELQVELGDPELALQQIEELNKDSAADAGIAILSKIYDGLRCEPRFRALVLKIKARDRKAEAICPKASG